MDGDINSQSVPAAGAQPTSNASLNNQNQTIPSETAADNNLPVQPEAAAATQPEPTQTPDAISAQPENQVVETQSEILATPATPGPEMQPIEPAVETVEALPSNLAPIEETVTPAQNIVAEPEGAIDPFDFNASQNPETPAASQTLELPSIENMQQPPIATQTPEQNATEALPAQPAQVAPTPEQTSSTIKNGMGKGPMIKKVLIGVGIAAIIGGLIYAAIVIKSNNEEAEMINSEYEFTDDFE